MDILRTTVKNVSPNALHVREGLLFLNNVVVERRESYDDFEAPHSALNQYVINVRNGVETSVMVGEGNLEILVGITNRTTLNAFAVELRTQTYTQYQALGVDDKEAVDLFVGFIEALYQDSDYLDFETNEQHLVDIEGLFELRDNELMLTDAVIKPSDVG